jgi:hypothetical protein
MICQRCKTENPANNKFCGSCGAELTAPPVPEKTWGSADAPPVPVPGDDGAFYCGKHKNAVTRLRCGRCETPICPKCTVFTPGGTRCRDCARNKIAVRPLGLVNEAGRVIDNAASSPIGRRIWYVAILDFIMSLFRGFGR